MIEIEQKYYTSKKVYDFLYHRAEFVGEKVLADSYFDDKKFNLTLHNRWLRERNGAWELKLPTEEFSTDLPSYFEYENEADIIRLLGLPLEKLSYENLKGLGYEPYASYTTLRKTFSHQGFRIDLDEMDFDLEFFEIELMVNEPSEIPEAKQRITDFVKTIDNDIQICEGGKMRRYLIMNHPELEKVMEERGIYNPLAL